MGRIVRSKVRYFTNGRLVFSYKIALIMYRIVDMLNVCTGKYIHFSNSLFHFSQEKGKYDD